MSVAMLAQKVHTHYDPTGTLLEVHHPGDRYEVHDSIGMTAEHLANTFEAMGYATRAEPSPELAPSTRSKKPKA